MQTTLYAAYTRDRKLLTITDCADSIPADVTRITFFPTNTPELTAMQLSFSALAHGLEYDVQTGKREQGYASLLCSALLATVIALAFVVLPLLHHAEKMVGGL